MTVFNAYRTWGLGTGKGDDWRTRAACRPGSGVDPELFHPVSVTSVTILLAQAVCNRCPETLECLREGAGIGDWQSIRGAMTGPERSRHHRAGLTPEQYPAPAPRAARTRRCLRCQEKFAVPDVMPNAQVCSGCRWARSTEPKPPCACGAAHYAVGMCRDCYNRGYRERERQRKAVQRARR